MHEDRLRATRRDRNPHGGGGALLAGVGVIIAGKHEFTWAVAASALVPLVLTLRGGGVRDAAAQRPSQHYHHAAHSLGEQLHGSSHRHA